MNTRAGAGERISAGDSASAGDGASATAGRRVSNQTGRPARRGARDRPRWRAWPGRNPSSLTLLGYTGALLLISFLHSPIWLAGLLAAAIVAAGPARWRLLRRSLMAVGLACALVSLGYLLLGSLGQPVAWLALLRLNLRVLLLVFMGFWFVSRVNVLQALAFSPTLSLVAALAAGHIVVFRRIAHQCRLGLGSRSAGQRFSTCDRLRQGAALSATLLDRAVSGAEQSTRALQARGCFDD